MYKVEKNTIAKINDLQSKKYLVIDYKYNNKLSTIRKNEEKQGLVRILKYLNNALDWSEIKGRNNYGYYEIVHKM